MKIVKNKKLLAVILVCITSVALLAGITIKSSNTSTVTYNDFITDVENNLVSQVKISDDSTLIVTLDDQTSYITSNPNTENFKEYLLLNDITVDANTNPNPLQSLLILVFFGTIIYYFASSRNKRLASSNVLKDENVKLEATNKTSLTFDDVAGNVEAKESLKDVVNFLKYPDGLSNLGVHMPKGVILYGSPGTGKTLLAKATAGEAGVPFFAVSGSDFMQMYVGVGASRIRELFAQARSHGKAVIFIDEIDAIGKKRASNASNGNSDEKDQTLNALLTEMSGFNESEGIVVIAATNRLDILDDALLRPGRFDRHIEVALPDVNARKKILNLHLKNKPTKDINIDELALKTSFFSGAKLENLVNEAGILAFKKNKEYIDTNDLNDAYSIVIAGYNKVDRDYISNVDREITAYHEIGHALASLLLLPNEIVSKVTIIPTTKGAGGYTLSIPNDSMYQTKEYLTNKVKVLLAGRAAEDIIFGENNITTGAHNDIQKATNIIVSMLNEYGMGNMGMLSVKELNTSGIQANADILAECKSLSESLYSDVKDLLIANRNTLDRITNELLSKETLTGDELTQLMNI